MSFASLRVRLLVAAAISIILALALAAAGLAWLFERHVERWIDSGLEVELNQLVGGLRSFANGADRDRQDAVGPAFRAAFVRSLLAGCHRAESARCFARARSGIFSSLCPTPRLTTPFTRAGCPAPAARRSTSSNGMSNFQRRWAAARPRLPSPSTPASCARPYGASLGR